MTRMILGIGAALAAAIALAGCGGSAGTGSGTVGATVSGGGMTTGGVAGAQTTKTTTTGGSLVQRAQQLQAQIRQAATAIRNGNAAGVMNAGLGRQRSAALGTRTASRRCSTSNSSLAVR